ncbi:MAG TPA: YkvA family protein [Rhodanobacteraceae bacterium]
MSMDISITLSDADLEHFVADFKAARQQAEKLDDADIIDGARKAITDKPIDGLPDFISSRLARIQTMIEMVEDAGFALPDEERGNTLAALAYFADPEDAIPDDVPVLGYLDDAIMIELCVRELKFEVEAYEDFRDWRNAEAKHRGEDPAKLKLDRVEWAEARRAEAIARMRRRRHSSYSSGSWRPTLFKVS